MKPVNKTQIYAYILCLMQVLFFLAFQTPVFAQCSTNNWSAVTGTPQALGIGTAPTGKKYEQNCGLTIDTSSVPAFVSTTSPASETMVTVRFYVLPESLSVTSGDVTLLRARDGTTAQFEIRLRSSGSVTFLVAFYRDNGSLVEHTEVLPLLDVWQAVEVSWSAGAGDGAFALKLDDLLQYSKTNLTNGTAVINEVDLGVVNSATATGDLVLDAFDLRRIGPVGLLTVNELRNISTRADVGTIDEIVIGGFIISGDTQKCVVVRGRGPSMNLPQGLAKLLDPTLDLKLGQTTIAFNDNWLDSPEAGTILGLGLEPSDNAESAIFVCIPPGPYTALLRGVGETTGIGIVEVLDADQGTPFLGNISTRAPVKTGDFVAIGGFIISGDQPKQVLIRARGPTVGVPQGVVRLSNPRLRLFDSTGTVIATNDDWGDAANAVDITATGKAPTDALESAILTTLAAGAYTAIVDGIGGVTGVGMVEVLDQSGGSITP